MCPADFCDSGPESRTLLPAAHFKEKYTSAVHATRKSINILLAAALINVPSELKKIIRLIAIEAVDSTITSGKSMRICLDLIWIL